jgi:hypothetical protein
MNLNRCVGFFTTLLVSHPRKRHFAVVGFTPALLVYVIGRKTSGTHSATVITKRSTPMKLEH